MSAAYGQSDDEDCPTMVTEALEAVGEACADLTRNQACYGNVQILPTFGEAAAEVVFESAGDMANLSDLSALQLSSLDTEAGLWGIAMLNAQANLPDTLPGQNVTILLFGDVEISAQAPNAEETSTLDLMGAFYFRSGFSDAPCTQAPNSGILIQTPEGEVGVNLTVNGVDIALHSTLYLQAEPEADMTISVIEGEAEITAADETVIAPAGTAVTVPLDENLTAAGAPSEPEPYDSAAIGVLPFGLLPRLIETSEGGAGGTIQLRLGTWTPRFDLEDPRFENCGNDLVGRQFVPPPFEMTTTDAGEFLAGVEQRLSDAGSGRVTYELTNPEPNHYIITGTGENSTFIFEYRVISPELIETISYTPGEGSCTIVSPGFAEYTGE
jgi:hypothetical protein